MAHTKKAAAIANKTKAKMANTKNAFKQTKYKKHKKLPLDSTPWEELSKNIKEIFKSKNKTQDEGQNDNQLLVLKNDADISKLNDPETKISQLKRTSLQNLNGSVHKKKKKIQICQETSNENYQNNISNDSPKNHSDTPIASGLELSTVNRLSKSQKRKLKRKMKKMSGLSSDISTVKSEVPVKSDTKKPLSKKKLAKNKLYEKKRLERRKELGIMLLPKNIENRLLRKRKALQKKNLPIEEIKSIMREERSKAQDEFRKSHATQMCFKCRKTGHLVANCPLNEDNNAITICLKCGSNEHKYTECKAKVLGFPFATCFICKEQGHISRDCPNNEHGIYPEGGKCNLCDSVKHLRKNCPTLKVKKPSVTLHTIDNGTTSIDDEIMDVEQSAPKVKSKKPKVVTF